VITDGHRTIMKNRKRAIFIALLLLLLFAAVTACGCSKKSQDCSYIHYSLRDHYPQINETYCKFISFEYPGCFVEIPQPPLPDLQCSELYFTNKRKPGYEHTVASNLGVSVHRKKSIGIYSVEDAIARDILYLNQYESVIDFSMSKQVPITLDEHPAVYIEYSYFDNGFPNYNTGKYVVMDYGDFIGILRLRSNYYEDNEETREELVELDEYFHHLIETFRIAD
jgi:hypothetical protein